MRWRCGMCGQRRWPWTKGCKPCQQKLMAAFSAAFDLARGAAAMMSAKRLLVALSEDGRVGPSRGGWN